MTATSPETISNGAWQQHLNPVLSPERGILIWIANVDSIYPQEIERLFVSLDASERGRAEQFRSRQDRHRYVAAHGLLRLALGEILGRPANAIVLEKPARGKPQLRRSEHDARRLKFNLSHASAWALIAIGYDRELGVDVESPASLPDEEQSLAKLAASFLSARELEVWKAIPNPVKQRAEFLRMWTRKEAYFKATGEGLRHDLADIELPMDAAPFNRWIVHDLSVPVELTAALAVEAC